MDLLRALGALGRIAWWEFVLFLALVEKPFFGRWPNEVDARWFRYLAHAELRLFLEG